MSFLIPKQIDDPGNKVTIQYNVKQKTIAEIYLSFGQEWAPPADGGDGTETQPPGKADLPGGLLFEDFSLSDVFEFTDLTREQVGTLAPSHVASVIAEIKKENHHFFAAIRKMVDLGKEAARQEPELRA